MNPQDRPKTDLDRLNALGPPPSVEPKQSRDSDSPHKKPIEPVLTVHKDPLYEFVNTPSEFLDSPDSPDAPGSTEWVHHERERRWEAFLAKYGKVIEDACGLEDHDRRDTDRDMDRD